MKFPENISRTTLSLSLSDRADKTKRKRRKNKGVPFIFVNFRATYNKFGLLFFPG